MRTQCNGLSRFWLSVVVLRSAPCHEHSGFVAGSRPLDYTTRTHHTTSDTFDHLIPEDLRQAAVVTATMLYNTAMRDELLPRVPLAP